MAEVAKRLARSLLPRLGAQNRSKAPASPESFRGKLDALPALAELSFKNSGVASSKRHRRKCIAISGSPR